MYNTAFYLKYRPQSLDELVGQDHIKKIILGAFAENRLSHAYLFAGPKGTGKTSTARILAKMVNCEKGITGGTGTTSTTGEKPRDTRDTSKTRGTSEVPCNECPTCLSITDGSNLDLIEIDAASNRGIEDIRSLREKIKLSPTSAKKKVYIIDEVHMLTTEAFNALLKTLEEPPNHALFILATTEQQKLPQTILSRVQRLDFKPSSNEQLLTVLQKIATLEKINIDKEVLKLLVKKSEGSFRDGIKLLDQLSSAGEKITAEMLQKNIRLANFDVILELIKYLIKKDTTASLSLIVKQTEEGVDAKELMLSLMDILRNLVFIKMGLGEQLVKLNYSEENFADLVKLSEKFENADLISHLDILQKALEKMKITSIPSLPLELAVVEICGDEKVSQVERVPQVPREEKPRDTRDTSKTRGTDDDTTITRKQEIPENIPSSLENTSDDILKLKEKWTLVLETIRPFNFSLEALLRSINITECTQNKVIIEVPYSFHQRILEAPKNRDLLESVLSDILGRGIQIATVLGNRNPRSEDIVNIEVAADDEIIRVAAEIFSSDSVN